MISRVLLLMTSNIFPLLGPGMRVSHVNVSRSIFSCLLMAGQARKTLTLAYPYHDGQERISQVCLGLLIGQLMSNMYDTLLMGCLI